MVRFNMGSGTSLLNTRAILQIWRIGEGTGLALGERWCTAYFAMYIIVYALDMSRRENIWTMDGPRKLSRELSKVEETPLICDQVLIAHVKRNVLGPGITGGNIKDLVDLTLIAHTRGTCWSSIGSGWAGWEGIFL